MKKKIKLQQLRLEREITQDMMATLLAMTQATYSRKERGLTDISDVEWTTIADILGVKKEEIFEANLKKQPPSRNSEKQFTILPDTLLEQIEFLKKENLELREQLKKFNP